MGQIGDGLYGVAVLIADNAARLKDVGRAGDLAVGAEEGEIQQQERRHRQAPAMVASPSRRKSGAQRRAPPCTNQGPRGPWLV